MVSCTSHTFRSGLLSRTHDFGSSSGWQRCTECLRGNECSLRSGSYCSAPSKSQHSCRSGSNTLTCKLGFWEFSLWLQGWSYPESGIEYSPGKKSQSWSRFSCSLSSEELGSLFSSFLCPSIGYLRCLAASDDAIIQPMMIPLTSSTLQVHRFYYLPLRGGFGVGGSDAGCIRCWSFAWSRYWVIRYISSSHIPRWRDCSDSSHKPWTGCLRDDRFLCACSGLSAQMVDQSAQSLFCARAIGFVSSTVLAQY